MGGNKTKNTKQHQHQNKNKHTQNTTNQTNPQKSEMDVSETVKHYFYFFFWLGAAWVKSRAERPSVSRVHRQLHVQIGCKLGIRNRKDELTKQAKRNKLQIKPEGNSRGERMQEKEEVIVNTSGRGYWVTRGHGKVSVTAPCAIEYILVTRWRGGKKGGQNRVCACDTRGRRKR